MIIYDYYVIENKEVLEEIEDYKLRADAFRQTVLAFNEKIGALNIYLSGDSHNGDSLCATCVQFAPRKAPHGWVRGKGRRVPDGVFRPSEKKTKTPAPFAEEFLSLPHVDGLKIAQKLTNADMVFSDMHIANPTYIIPLRIFIRPRDDAEVHEPPMFEGFRFIKNWEFEKLVEEYNERAKVK